MVSLHNGFGGQNLGLNRAKFMKGELHQGLFGFCGDLLTLDDISMGIPKTVFIRAQTKIAPITKIFFVSMVVC